MLIYLEHDGLQNEGGRWAHSEGLFGLGQPVNEILQWVMEVCGHRQGPPSSFTYDQSNTSFHLRFMYRDNCESLLGDFQKSVLS